MKIKVCIPFYSEFEDTKSGLHDLINISDHEFFVEPRQGVLVGNMRNKMVSSGSQKKIQKVEGFDAYLFIDSDITFDAHQVLKLIGHDKDIVTGVYRTQKEDKYEAGLFYPAIPGAVMTRYNMATRGMQRVDFCGAGFLLVKREVFENMEYPWFRHHMVTNNGDQEEAGEDYGFCINARRSGFEIWADFDCVVGHRIRKLRDFNWKLHP